ncbi:helix-turn-helix transcriptional regulator [Streptomyces sp. NPDC007100]|uniref:helix-turn-helix domain-containing protein n=1 Tax=unclassified Streptomyces TaxID=2593676 RepID=UPI00340A81CC
MGCARGAEPTQSPREFYGEELRIRREDAGMTQEQLGERAFCSGSLIAHYEAGRRKPPSDVAMRLDDALGTGTFFYRMRRTLNAVRFPDFFAAAAEAEQRATVIEEYAATLVPGILQTEAYARAVFRAYQPSRPPAEIDQLVVNRRGRARILDKAGQPRVWVILSENVIRAAVGGPAVMGDQVAALARLAQSGRVQVQVVPHGAGAHATMSSMLSLMRFAEEPDVAYVEALHTGWLEDDPATVQKYRYSYDLARAAALSLPASHHLLEAVAEEYARDH